MKLLFSTNNLPGSYLIRWATWSRYSHVDLVVSDFSVIGASFTLGGVREYPITQRIKDSTHWAFYDVKADDAAVITQARMRLGRPYDWTGVLGIGLHRDWQAEDKWFCSELVAKCFLDAGAPLLNPETHVSRVTPENLLLSPLLHMESGITWNLTSLTPS